MFIADHSGTLTRTQLPSQLSKMTCGVDIQRQSKQSILRSARMNIYKCLSFVILLVFMEVKFTSGQGNATTFRELFFREAGHRLSGVPVRQLSDSSIDHCAENCVKGTDFECKSFDLDNVDKTCLLYAVSQDDRDVHLISDDNVDHYRTTYIRLFHHLPNHRLTSTHNGRYEGVSQEDCARRCILETYFKCRGFDYELGQRICWLTMMTPERAGGIRILKDWSFYERVPDGALAHFIHYGFGRMRQISGNNVYAKSIMGVTLETCATMCIAEQTFHCLSIDFVADDRDSQTCYLSRFIAANVYGLIGYYDTKSMHFERKDKYLARFYATPYAVVLGNNHKEYSRVTPEKCAQNCLVENSFICRSFDYKIQDGTCMLSSKTGSDVGGLMLQNMHEIHHFEMKPILDCGGNRTDDFGDIASPNWPRNYAHHERCHWNIVVSRHKVIRFKFTHLDLGLRFHDPCSDREDRVVITEQLSSHDTDSIDEAGSFCVLPNTKTFMTRSNKASLSFLTNGVGDGQGFRVFYNAEWPCDVLLTKAPGEFASPNYPENYPPSTTCSWRLTAPEGRRLRVKITAFELEKHTLGHCNDKYDHLLILDGGSVTAPRIGLYCGTQSSFTVRSTGRDMFVQFKSDASIMRSGFHAHFDFELQNGTIAETTSESEMDEVVPLDSDGLETNSVYLGQPGVGKRVGSAGSYTKSDRYGATMWSIITILLILLIIAFVIIFILWRQKRGNLGQQEEQIIEDHYDEVPLHNPSVCSPVDGRQNNQSVQGSELGATGGQGAASPLLDEKSPKDLLAFFYKPNNIEEDNKANLKQVNLDQDSKC